MNPRITSMENLIAHDPVGRNVFHLMISDQLRLAAQSLRLARRVGIVTGFFIPQAGSGETDGPPGAKVLGRALSQLGVKVDYITDCRNASLLSALGIEPLIEPSDYLSSEEPTHLISIERAGRGTDGRYRNMRGVDITDHTAPLDQLFIDATTVGITTIGIGDGGNEIGMGKAFSATLQSVPNGPGIASIVATDYCIAAGVSNWGAYGLAAALSVLCGRDLLPSARDCAADIERLTAQGGAVDGLTHRNEPTVDGLLLDASVRILEELRGHIRPSPLEQSGPLSVGILGYGETGRASAELLAQRGHRVYLSDSGDLSSTPTCCVSDIETGGHTIEFLERCDLVVASPGVRPDAPIRSELHHRGVPVWSGLELAYQLCTGELIAVTGTVGKRSTVELMQHLFGSCGTPFGIGGNKGRPLAALLADEGASRRIALAVSSYQLETVVHFRPHIAVVLNIDDAHLDRHRTIAEYIRIKSRIFMNHQPDDVLILPHDDPRLRALLRKHHGQTLLVSRSEPPDNDGAWIDGDSIRVNLQGKEERFAAPVAGSYPYWENLLASVLVCRLCGIDSDAIGTALATAPIPGRDS